MTTTRKLKIPPRERTCCGVVEEVREKRANRKNGQPWITLKLMIGFTLGIMGYSAYVYIARLCVKMINRRNGAGGSRGAGIALLSVFLVLYTWMVWAYFKVVLTSPGYAKDHVSKQPRPLIPEPTRPTSWNTLDHVVEHGNPHMHHSHPSFSTVHTELHPVESIAGPSYENIPIRHDSGIGGTDQPQLQAKSLDVPRDTEVAALDDMQSSPTINGKDENSKLKILEHKHKRGDLNEKPTIHLDRRPPTVPILMPGHRYCTIDEIVKPYRTHHCRTCGTCVLKFDHHCPWIGQCVGARNHKFFVNFVQSAFVFTSYTFATLLTYIIRNAKANGNIDPQEIVVLALAAMFILFTGPLLVTHVHLIWVSQTTVESLQVRALRDQEETALANTLGCCQIMEKRRVRRRWDEEWGEFGKEGNIWWLGNGTKGWVDVMGTNRWGWIFPIGRSQSDGLTYPVNPRFDTQGRWRRRIDWSPDLR